MKSNQALEEMTENSAPSLQFASHEEMRWPRVQSVVLLQLKKGFHLGSDYCIKALFDYNINYIAFIFTFIQFDVCTIFKSDYLGNFNIVESVFRNNLSFTGDEIWHFQLVGYDIAFFNKEKKRVYHGEKEYPIPTLVSNLGAIGENLIFTI